MFFDIVDMTTTYIQYLSLLIRISPESFPSFYTETLAVFKYFVLDFFTSVDEDQRFNNPLKVSLPQWMPLDVRLQFVCISVIAPLALATLGTLGTHTKLGYVWLVITLGALFIFVFGAAMVANPQIYSDHKQPSMAVRVVLICVGIPAFAVCLVGGFISSSRGRKRQMREDVVNLTVFQEEELHRRDVNPVTQRIVEREHLSVEALAAERARQKRRSDRVEFINWLDVSLQTLFVVVLFFASLVLTGVIPISGIRALQSTTVFRAIGIILFSASILSLLWLFVSCFRAGRKVKEAIASFMSRKILSLVIICSSFLYISMVTNLISILYCAAMTCNPGSRPPNGGSVFPQSTATSSSIDVGCVDCDIQNFPQKCAVSLQNELCGGQIRQLRLVYDTRVRCDLIDGFFRASGIIVFTAYVFFLPVLQFILARHAVTILTTEFPLEHRFYEIFTEEELYYEKVITSKNNAAFMYRAYKRHYKYYKLSFLFQKLLLAVVSCTTRRGLAQDRAWIGLSLFLIIPLIALTCAVVLKPFARPTEAIYFPVLQFIVSLCAAYSLAGHQLGRDRIPRGLGVFLAVVVIFVPILTLVVATILTLRVERRRSDLLRQRLANVFASGISHTDGRRSGNGFNIADGGGGGGRRRGGEGEDEDGEDGLSCSDNDRSVEGWGATSRRRGRRSRIGTRHIQDSDRDDGDEGNEEDRVSDGGNAARGFSQAFVDGCDSITEHKPHHQRDDDSVSLEFDMMSVTSNADTTDLCSSRDADREEGDCSTNAYELISRTVIDGGGSVSGSAHSGDRNRRTARKYTTTSGSTEVKSARRQQHLSVGNRIPSAARRLLHTMDRWMVNGMPFIPHMPGERVMTEKPTAPILVSSLYAGSCALGGDGSGSSRSGDVVHPTPLSRNNKDDAVNPRWSMSATSGTVARRTSSFVIEAPSHTAEDDVGDRNYVPLDRRGEAVDAKQPKPPLSRGRLYALPKDSVREGGPLEKPAVDWGGVGDERWHHCAVDAGNGDDVVSCGSSSGGWRDLDVVAPFPGTTNTSCCTSAATSRVLNSYTPSSFPRGASSTKSTTPYSYSYGYNDDDDDQGSFDPSFTRRTMAPRKFGILASKNSNPLISRNAEEQESNNGADPVSSGVVALSPLHVDPHDVEYNNSGSSIIYIPNPLLKATTRPILSLPAPVSKPAGVVAGAVASQPTQAVTSLLVRGHARGPLHRAGNNRNSAQQSQFVSVPQIPRTTSVASLRCSVSFARDPREVVEEGELGAKVRHKLSVLRRKNSGRDTQKWKKKQQKHAKDRGGKGRARSGTECFGVEGKEGPSSGGAWLSEEPASGGARRADRKGLQRTQGKTSGRARNPEYPNEGFIFIPEAYFLREYYPESAGGAAKGRNSFFSFAFGNRKTRASNATVVHSSDEDEFINSRGQAVMSHSSASVSLHQLSSAAVPTMPGAASSGEDSKDKAKAAAAAAGNSTASAPVSIALIDAAAAPTSTLSQDQQQELDIGLSTSLPTYPRMSPRSSCLQRAGEINSLSASFYIGGSSGVLNYTPTGPTPLQHQSSRRMPLMRAREHRRKQEAPSYYPKQLLKLLRNTGVKLRGVMGLDYTQKSMLSNLKLASRGLLRSADEVLTFPTVYVRRKEAQKLKYALARGRAAAVAAAAKTDASDDEREGAGTDSSLQLFRPLWTQPTDAMLGAAQVPGSSPPWFFYCSARAATKEVDVLVGTAADGRDGSGTCDNRSKTLDLIVTTHVVRCPTMFGEISAIVVKNRQRREEQQRLGGNKVDFPSSTATCSSYLTSPDMNGIASRNGEPRATAKSNSNAKKQPVNPPNLERLAARRFSINPQLPALGVTGYGFSTVLSDSTHSVDAAPAGADNSKSNIGLEKRRGPLLQQPGGKDQSWTGSSTLSPQQERLDQKKPLLLHQDEEEQEEAAEEEQPSQDSVSVSSLDTSRAALWRVVCIAQAKNRAAAMQRWFTEMGCKLPVTRDAVIKDIDVDGLYAALMDGYEGGRDPFLVTPNGTLSAAFPSSDTNLLPSMDEQLEEDSKTAGQEKFFPVVNLMSVLQNNKTTTIRSPSSAQVRASVSDSIWSADERESSTSSSMTTTVIAVTNGHHHYYQHHDGEASTAENKKKKQREDRNDEDNNNNNNNVGTYPAIATPALPVGGGLLLSSSFYARNSTVGVVSGAAAAQGSQNNTNDTKNANKGRDGGDGGGRQRGNNWDFILEDLMREVVFGSLIGETAASEDGGNPEKSNSGSGHHDGKAERDKTKEKKKKEKNKNKNKNWEGAERSIFASAPEPFSSHSTDAAAGMPPSASRSPPLFRRGLHFLANVISWQKRSTAPHIIVNSNDEGDEDDLALRSTTSSYAKDEDAIDHYMRKYSRSPGAAKTSKQQAQHQEERDQKKHAKQLVNGEDAHSNTLQDQTYRTSGILARATEDVVVAAAAQIDSGSGSGGSGDYPKKGPRAAMMVFSSPEGGSSLMEDLRCHFLLRKRLKETFWEHRARLKAVQSAIDNKIAVVTRRVLSQLLTLLGVVATVCLALSFCAMLNTVDTTFLSGIRQKDNSVGYELADYRDWDTFTLHCCCIAATSLKAKFPYYALDAENWMCDNGVTKERIRRDGYDNNVYSGYRVRPLCGMNFINGCKLVVKDGEARVVDCDDPTISANEIQRW